MVDLNKIERMIEENKTLSKEEIDLGKQLKLYAKMEKKRIRIRIDLIDSELKVAKKRESIAETNRKLIEKKTKLKQEGLLEIDDQALKNDLERSIYIEKMAANQKSIAEINKKIIQEEEEIASAKLKLGLAHNTLALARVAYIKKLTTFLQYSKMETPADKLEVAVKSYMDAHNVLVEKRKELEEVNSALKIKHNALADLKKDLAAVIAEGHKIRHLELKEK